MRYRLVPAATLLLGFVALGFGGCGPELESIATLAHVRIIAVRKSAPYARPGENVRLQMLWEDVSAAPPRPVQPFFAFWCVNPAGGLFAECLAQAPTIPPAFSVGQNTIGPAIIHGAECATDRHALRLLRRVRWHARGCWLSATTRPGRWRGRW
jgi:hypothetical protein